MKQAKVLTDREMKRLLAVVADGSHNERNRLAIMLSHFAGLRVGEIASLKISDVVNGEGQVRDQLRLSPSQTKGGIALTVFMNWRLQRQIYQYLDSLPALSAPEAALLLSQRGGSFSANTLCQLFGELYRRAGIDGASSHSGRRGFITKLAHSGVSAKIIMELAGHKHLSTTQKYIEVNDEMKRAAVEILN
ncbi:MAG: site-specific integrase [Alphaproteobacteria bacterium]